MDAEYRQGQEVLVEAYANLFRGIEGVGGRMKVTRRAVIFEPHALNVQSQPEEIPVSEVVEVGARKTFGFIPNGMFIRTTSGREYRFVVWQRDKLIRSIRDVAQSAGSR